MATVIKSLILVKGREPIDVSDKVNSSITTFIGKRLYAVISRNGLVPEAIDVNRLINQTANLKDTDTYASVIQTHVISDLDAAGIQAAYLPQINTNTGMYMYRINVLDPITTSGYDVGYGSIDDPNIANDVYRMDTATDLLITTSLTDASLKNVLVAVNGLIHKTVLNNGTLYVQDGYLTMRQSRKQNVVIMDTSSLGGHTTYRITDDMIKNNADFTNRFVIDTTGVIPTFKNKTIMLYLDGILYPMDTTIYTLSGDSKIAVNSSLIDWISNFVNNPGIRTRIDVFGVKNRPNPFNPDQILTSSDWGNGSDADDTYLNVFVEDQTVSQSIFTRDYFKSRITGPHSGIVVINNSEVYLKRYALQNYNEPYRYEHFNKNDMPRGILRYNHGKVLPYTIISGKDGQHIVTLGLIDKTGESYATVKDVTVIPSPKADSIDPNSTKFAELVEIYSGTSGTI